MRDNGMSLRTILNIPTPIYVNPIPDMLSAISYTEKTSIVNQCTPDQVDHGPSGVAGGGGGNPLNCTRHGATGPIH